MLRVYCRITSPAMFWGTMHHDCFSTTVGRTLEGLSAMSLYLFSMYIHALRTTTRPLCALECLRCRCAVISPEFFLCFPFNNNYVPLALGLQSSRLLVFSLFFALGL